MKKFFALVLALCLLMSAAAFAEPSVVLQDEQAPQVVTSVNQAGEMIVGQIFDKDGNAVAEIKNDGTLVLTDVHHRKEADEVVAVRLLNAYNSVMDNVHHADVECELHEHDVKVDVDTILASIDNELDSHDLVMYELFDVMLSDEAAALLVDGSYLELTFELMEGQVLPLITMFTNDGIEWKVIPTMPVSANRFTVQLTEVGTIALLNDGRKSMGIGEEEERVIEVIPGEEGGEDSDDHSNFTPSVSGKTAPETVIYEGKDGETYVGYIRNDLDDVVIGVPDANYIIITAVAERDYVVDVLTHEHLEWSYDCILEAEDVGDLYTEHDMSVTIPDSEHGTIAGLLDETLEQMKLDLTHDQLVVKDLFEVTAYGDYLHYLYDENYYLEVTFDADLDPRKPLVIIHSADSQHWHVHPIEDAVLNADGTVTMKMYDLGAVAFLVEADEEMNAETAVLSPN